MPAFPRSRVVAAAAAVAVCAGVALAPTQAKAWWRGGVFIGLPPVFVAPPYYYPPVYAPPPVVYAPPPVVYDPSAVAAQSAPVASAGSCAAGAYVCPLDQPLNPGTPCSCPANRGRVSGYAR